MRDYAKKILKKYLPASINDYNMVDKEALFNAFKSRYGGFPVVAKINSVEDLYKDAEARTTSILRGKIISEMLDIDKSDILGDRRTTDILKSDEYVSEINEKIQRKYNAEFNLFMKTNLLKRFDSRMLDKKNNLTEDPAIEQDLIKTAILITTTEQGLKLNVYDRYVYDAKKVILEKFPNCVKDGDIDYEKLNAEYKEYISQVSKVTKVDYGEYSDDIVQDEWNRFRDGQKFLFRNLEMKQDPNRAKKYQEELKEITIKNRAIHKQNEEKNVYEFLSIISKGRSGENLDTNTTKSLEKLSERVEKRLKNKINDDEYNAYVKDVKSKEYDPEAFKVLSRNAKLTLIANEPKDVINFSLNQRIDKDKDLMRKVFDYYIGTKRDLDQEPLEEKSDAKIKMKIINYVMRKTVPDAFENGKFNDDVMLNKYNELFGTDYKTSDELYSSAEDRVLGMYTDKLVSAIDNRDGYQSVYAASLVNGKFFRKVNERNLTRLTETSKVTDKEMKGVMDKQAEEIVVDPTVLQKSNDKKRDEGKDTVDSQVISGDDIAAVFDTKAVELGGEESKKVEQNIDVAPKIAQAESIEIDSNNFGQNLPVKQEEKGFFSNIINNIKTSIQNGIKNIKDKIFGTTESNTETGTTDNNTSGTTSGTGGVNKDEQDAMNLTGHGKINLVYGTPASVGEDDKKSKSMESTDAVRSEGEEK